MFRILLICLLFTTTPAGADIIIDPSQISDLEFQGSIMGQTPDEGMICKSGSCLDNWSEQKNDSERIDIARYKKPVDITHHGTIEISTPRYEFYRNQLFQVTFNLLCGKLEAAECIDSAIETLDERYGLSMTRPGSPVPSNEEGINRQYVSRSGALVDTVWAQPGELGSHPAIKIYDKTLMDALRQEANPLYIPKEIKLAEEEGH